MSHDCVFCAIVAGEAPAHVVHEDEHTVAFLDINPATRGHTLVVPRRHATDMWEVDRDDAAQVMAAGWEVAQLVRTRLDAAGVNHVVATRPAAWQTVYHLHLHVIPRYHPEELTRPWTPTPGDPDDLVAVASRLTG